MADHKLRLIIEGVDNASGPIGNVNRALGNMAQIAGGIGIAGAINSISTSVLNMGRAAVDSFAQYERLSMSLNSLAAREALQSGQAATMGQALAQTTTKAKELTDWIQKLALESPFSADDVSSAFRLSMAYGFTTAEAQRMTRAMLDFAAGSGASSYAMDRVALAMGQIQARGKLSAQELNQLSEAGVNAREIIADAMGVSTAEVMALTEKGLIPASTALNALVQSFERDFAGAAKAQAGSVSGLIESFGDIGSMTGRNLMGGIIQAFQPVAAEMVAVFSAPEFQAGVTALGAAMGAQVDSSLGVVAGYVTDISTAMDKFPKEMPAPLAFLFAAPAPSQASSVADTLATIQGVIDAIGAGDFNLAFNLVYTEQGTDVKAAMDWVKWFAGETNREYSALVSIGKGASEWWDTWSAWFSAESTRELKAAVNFTGFVGDFWTNYGTWFSGEASKEVTAAIRFADDAGEGLTAWWENWKLENEAANASWEPTITAIAQWSDGIWSTLSSEAQANFNEPVMLAGSWTEGVFSGLWNSLQANFNEPVMLLGSWFGGVAEALWKSIQSFFSGNPISVGVKTQTSYTDNSRPIGIGPSQSFPVDITPPAPQTYDWQVETRAKGDSSFSGGMALVGEEGPELVILPQGARIFSNQDTRGMIPGFAEGVGTSGAGGSPLISILQSLGLWIPQNNPQDDYATRHMQQAAESTATAFGDAATATANAFGDAAGDSANDWTDTFKSALQGVEGLFGTSSVTGDQMRMAELGVPQNFADDYLRRLSDEVLNGVDWEGVDIKDAANRAGIDPNLPANVILELVKQAWNDSSLFANAQNLDLINQDAVKAAIEQQQKQAAGQANILALFGLTDEGIDSQVDGLGQALSSVFGKAADGDAMKAAGAQVFANVAGGFADDNAASMAVGNMAGAVLSAAGNADNQAALMNVGATWFEIIWKGFAAAAGASTVPPLPNPPGVGETPPPGTDGKALGGYAGGWTVVGEFGPELVNLPNHSRVYDAATTRKMRASAARGRTTIVNQQFVVNDQLMAEMAARKAVAMIQRGR